MALDVANHLLLTDLAQAVVTGGAHLVQESTDDRNPPHRTIALAAEMLGEDEDWLCDVANEMDQEVCVGRDYVAEACFRCPCRSVERHSGAETVGFWQKSAKKDGRQVMATDHPSKDAWDKLSAVSGVVAAVLVPVVIAFVGNMYSVALKEREARLSEESSKREWVQVGLSVLRDASASRDLRAWAIKIITSNSAIELPANTGEVFIERKSTLPPAAQTAMPTGSVALVERLETQGIAALLKRDLAGAIAAYDQAYEQWPTFRNVDEIRTFLRETAPGNEEQWKDLYKMMLRNYDLRGVDQNVIAQLRASAQ